MKYRIDRFQNYKLAISRILGENGLEAMAMDFEVVDRIFNLLTEDKSVFKIEGLISTTEIVKYGGEIKDNKTKVVYSNILDWWDANRF